MKITKRQLKRIIAEELDTLSEALPALGQVAAATIAANAAKEIIDDTDPDEVEEEELEVEEEVEEESEAEAEEQVRDSDLEPIVMRIRDEMLNANIIGPAGLMDQVDDIDELEDLLRLILGEVGIDKQQLASVALEVARDFLETPDVASKMSSFDL